MTDAIRAHLPFVDGVVFDYGGVIGLSPRGAWKAEEFCLSRGLSRAAFDKGFDDYRNLLDAGSMTSEEMYSRIFADNSLAPLSAAELAEVARLDQEGWSERFSERTLAFMREAKAAGKKLGVLSNMSPEFARDYYMPRAARYRELLDAETLSGFERVCKPSPRIYEIMAGRMGVAPSRLVFVDDSPVNLAAARACGWRAEEYVERL